MRKILWRAEAACYDIVSAMLGLLPFSLVSGFGGWLVRIIGPLTSKQAIARRGLQTAFPDASESEINALLKAQWDNTGRTFAEFPILHRIHAFDPDAPIKVDGLEKLEALKKSGEAAILISGHFANWEIMAMIATQFGLPVQITYRHINNPYLDKRVRAQREAYGTKFMVPKSGAKGARELLAALKAGESIGLMNDQKFNEGLAVPFFGVDAMTAQGPVRMALKTGAALIPSSVTRDKAAFTCKIYDPIELENTGDTAADIKAGVLKVNQFIEARIRENPAQWFWVHRRWPKAHYKTPDQAPKSQPETAGKFRD